MDRRMLIADRDYGIRELLARFFKARGFIGDVAADEKEALTLVRGKEYDLIVTEDRLSANDGLELVGKIRSSAPNAYLVAIAAFSNPEELYGVGVDNYLRKPFSLLDFECLLKRYFALRATG